MEQMKSVVTSLSIRTVAAQTTSPLMNLLLTRTIAILQWAASLRMNQWNPLHQKIRVKSLITVSGMKQMKSAVTSLSIRTVAAQMTPQLMNLFTQSIVVLQRAASLWMNQWRQLRKYKRASELNPARLFASLSKFCLSRPTQACPSQKFRKNYRAAQL